MQLLQGAGGVGKSVLLTALQTCVQREHLGQMVITAWTGVAAAPFATKTVCSLLKLDFTTLDQEKAMVISPFIEYRYILQEDVDHMQKKVELNSTNAPWYRKNATKERYESE